MPSAPQTVAREARDLRERRESQGLIPHVSLFPLVSPVSRYCPAALVYCLATRFSTISES